MPGSGLSPAWDAEPPHSHQLDSEQTQGLAQTHRRSATGDHCRGQHHPAAGRGLSSVTANPPPTSPLFQQRTGLPACFQSTWNVLELAEILNANTQDTRFSLLANPNRSATLGSKGRLETKAPASLRAALAGLPAARASAKGRNPASSITLRVPRLRPPAEDWEDHILSLLSGSGGAYWVSHAETCLGWNTSRRERRSRPSFQGPFRVRSSTNGIWPAARLSRVQFQLCHHSPSVTTRV